MQVARIFEGEADGSPDGAGFYKTRRGCATLQLEPKPWTFDVKQ